MTDNREIDIKAIKKRRRRRRVPISLLAYIIFTVIIIVLCAVFLVYVSDVVEEYDKAQPEHIMQAETEKLKSTVENGGIDGYMDISAIYNRYYGKPESAYKQDYTAFLKNAENIDYRLDAGASVGLENAYLLVADGKPFARVWLAGENERTKLFFFSMADWSVKSIEPLQFYDEKELTLFIPDEVTCFVNGVEVGGIPNETDDGILSFTLRGLPDNVTVKYERADGSALGYTSDKGVIKPAVYKYGITLPADISVFADGEKQTGVPNGEGSMNYEISGMTLPVVELYDIFGNKYVYDGEPNIPLTGFVVELPENFAIVASDGSELKKDMAERAENPYNAELNQYLPDIKLTDMLTYHLSAFADKAEISIADNLGRVEKHEIDAKYLFTINRQVSADKVPDELIEQIDPLRFAREWSLFMTNDEEFENISGYFLKGSKYYQEAYRWAHGIDRTFTSSHDTPTIKDESMKDYIRYSDNCFSVRVSLMKTMHLTKSGRNVVDKLDMVIYFVKQNSTWIVAVKHDA